MIPASCAVVSASPFGRSRRRRAVSGAIRTTARATARRRCDGFAADVDHLHRPALVDVREVAHAQIPLRHRDQRPPFAPRRPRACASRRARRRGRGTRASPRRRRGTTTARERVPSRGRRTSERSGRRGRASSACARSPTAPRAAPGRLRRSRRCRHGRCATRCRPQLRRDARRALGTARPHRRPQPEAPAFAARTAAASSADARDGHDGAEDLLALDARVGGHVDQHGRLVEPARRDPGRRPPATARAPRPSASTTSSSTCARCSLGDQRPELERPGRAMRSSSTNGS